MDVTPHRSSDRSAPAAPAGSPEPLEIAALTRRLVEGNDMAYRQFHTAYVDRLTRYLLVITAGDEHAAREALQATFTRVVRNIRVFEDEPSFWSWLTVLARSARADDRRKRRRYLAFLDRFTRHAELVPVASAGLPVDPMDQLLTHHVARLPSDERELVELKYTETHSVREIATHLGTTEKAVESRLTRIRRKLKAAILAELKHEPPR